MLNTKIPALAAVSVMTAASMAAASIQISVTGFDFSYDGEDITDADAAGSDELASVDFFSDGVLVGSLTPSDGIAADLLVEDVLGIPVGGGVVTSAATLGFGLDLTFGPNDFLFLDLEDVQVFYSGSQIGVTGVTGDVDVALQNLPFGLEIDEGEPVSFSFSGLITDLTDNGQFVTSFDASGTAEVRGEIIPEPASIAMLGLGGLTLLRRRR
ncbi:MAG: PEP-CTERM sorting domain-containing protein [Planctomycetota bacterium]